MAHVVVRTHGGLGNQLFQLLYARLYARVHGADLSEIHDLRYAHAFGRSGELARAPAPAPLRRMISGLRIPKLATRIGSARNAVHLVGTIYLDGYFQQVEDYAGFSDAILRDELIRLRNELCVSNAPARERGMHLRLGDFFASDADVVAHLVERLKKLGPDTSIVTNEEDRLAAPEIAAILTANGARVVPTGDMTPEQVLRTLASFRHVDGNDSTLLFWASVLSGMDCEYRNVNLRMLRERFIHVLAS